MLKNYFKIAWRNLTNSKLYASINIVGLTLGIASVLLIILYIQYEFSYDEYHEKKERIYRILDYGGFDEKEWGSYVAGNPVIEMRKNFIGVEDAVRLINCGGGTVWVGEQKYTKIEMACTESNIFNIFTFPLIAGSKTKVLDAPFTTVISKSTAERFFGSENPVGQTITVRWRYSKDGKKEFEVTGVMEDIPDNTHFRYNMFLSYVSLKDTRRCLDCGQLMYALLEENADTAAIANLILNLIREIDGKKYVADIRLQPLDKVHFSSIFAPRQGNWQYVKILTLIALVILALGCANYMNLATARYSQRSQEVGIRKAVGAHRWQLSRQFLLETLLITVCTIPLAIILLKLAIPWFNSYADTQVSLSILNNLWFYVALIGVVIVTGLIAGSYPALFVSSFEPNEVLKGNTKISFGSAFLRKGLVTFQFFAGVVMIAVTVLILQQLHFVQQKNLGFDSDKLVTITIHDAAMMQKAQAIKQELLRLSVVESATASSAPATGRFGYIGYVFEVDSIPGKKFSFQNPRVDEDFIETMGITLIAGRNISPEPIDTTKDKWGLKPREALINQTGINVLGFTNPKNIIGEIVGQGRYRIVGVVEDFHFKSLQTEIEPLFLRPNDLDRTYSITVRLAGGNIREGLKAIKSTWQELGAPSQLDYTFVNDLIQQQYEQERHTAWVIGVFAFISILLACLGLFGLAAFSAQRRTKEIGIRKVMGATVANIVGLLSKDFLKLVLIGFVIAVPMAWYFMHQWLQDFAYRIDIGIGIFLLAGGLALLIALATVSWQSIRAALANPVDSLRSE